MLVIRPVSLDDLDRLYELAAGTGYGLTSLPRDRELLQSKIVESQESFGRLGRKPHGDSYLFVLEDVKTGMAVGTTGIVSKVGGFEPFYAYLVETAVAESEVLKVRKTIRCLKLVTNHNGPCEVGSLFLSPEYRKDGNGRLLSLVRFLFIAEYPKRFDPTVIAELRGIVDDQGHSPFWEALGRHFFDTDYPNADYLSVVDKKFIADLMPAHPIYIPLLPREAQDVIGKVHPQSQPALEMLREEGFRENGMIDIFDAGPIVSCKRDDIRSVRESRRAVVEDIVEQPPRSETHIIATAQGISRVQGNGRTDANRSASQHRRGTGVASQCWRSGAICHDESDAARGGRGETRMSMSVTRRHFIAGHWIGGEGEPFHSTDPATGAAVWHGHAATESNVNSAVHAARSALETWADSTVDLRIGLLNGYADQLRRRKNEFAEAISHETGKPNWEALTEVDAMINKVAISVEAFRERRRDSEREQAGAVAATRYKPMGVMAVFGPFNMPGHLPNGHIVPALLAGNTIVFKPSELTPGVGEKMADALHAAGIPAGVVNLVQGGREAGAMLARHHDIDGILFTGSVAGGVALSKATIDQPGKILALEMGGNNPLVVWEAKDHEAAAYLTVQSAYITSGQRCSCARRLIVSDDATGNAFVERLIAMIGRIQVGPFTHRPEPFMGPVINHASADRLLAAQAELVTGGAVPLVEMRVIGDRRAMLRPGLIDVTPIVHRPDTEIFGPLLQLIRVRDFDTAVAEANHTAYGLAAGLFSDNADLWRLFYRKIRAGVVYWNRQTTGGSGALPFGGIGLSGNHRPSGYWAADYCSYPVASMENAMLTMPASRVPGIGET